MIYREDTDSPCSCEQGQSVRDNDADKEFRILKNLIENNLLSIELKDAKFNKMQIYSWDGKIRKYTKSKLSFPSDDAVKKMVYLSLMEIEKKWTMPITNWGLIMNQFMLIFENRIQI